MCIWLSIRPGINSFLFRLLSQRPDIFSTAPYRSPESFPGNRHIHMFLQLVILYQQEPSFINKSHVCILSSPFSIGRPVRYLTPAVISSRYQITPARLRSIWSQGRSPRKVPVITKIPTISIFQPWLMNVFNWSLMARPQTPNHGKGGREINVEAACITKSLTGEIGDVKAAL